MKVMKCNPPSADDYHFVFRQEFTGFDRFFSAFHLKRQKINYPVNPVNPVRKKKIFVVGLT